jgi:hypothetical protein
VRVLAVVGVLLLTACGASTAAKPTPTPSPSPTPDVGALYTDAVNKTFNYLSADYAAVVAAKVGSADESLAAIHLSRDYQFLLDALDKIPFPASAAADLSTLRKTLVALQIFWSNVSSDTTSYYSLTETSLGNANNQAELVLGHDVGVSLVVSSFASPTPSP